MRDYPDCLVLPPRTMVRRGAADDLLRECAAFGPRGVLVHGASLAAGGSLDRILARAPQPQAVEAWRHPGGEPTLDHLDGLLGVARRHGADWVAGAGGGSVLDLAKACAGLLRAPLPTASYHDGAALPPAAVPFVAAPTTAGTGSEATAVCVFTNGKTGVKKSFRHPSMLARLVLLDADLLRDCPQSVIASSGMDAFVQAVESYVSRGATWFSDQFALKAVEMIAGTVEQAFSRRDSDSLERLLVGSFFAGIALSHARLGIVHGLAHPLGSRYHVPHGLACGVCLPSAIEFNRSAMGGKYGRLSEAAGGDLLGLTRRLLTALRIESPFAGRRLDDVAGIVAETLASGSTAANPRVVAAADVEALLRTLFAPA